MMSQRGKVISDTSHTIHHQLCFIQHITMRYRRDSRLCVCYCFIQLTKAFKAETTWLSCPVVIPLVSWCTCPSVHHYVHNVGMQYVIMTFRLYPRAGYLLHDLVSRYPVTMVTYPNSQWFHKCDILHTPR